jgi:hypothetical protein
VSNVSAIYKGLLTVAFGLALVLSAEGKPFGPGAGRGGARSSVRNSARAANRDGSGLRQGRTRGNGFRGFDRAGDRRPGR